MKVTGTIKVLSFKDDRVVIKLTDAQFLSKEGDWEKQYGDVWISSFNDSVIQSIRLFNEDDDSLNMQKGSEIQAAVKVNKSKDGREFMNIVNIGLKIPDKDVNEDLRPPDMPTGASGQPPLTPEEEQGMLKQEAIEEQASNELDKIVVSKEVLIIRQTCIKAAGHAFVNMGVNAKDVVAIAKRLEKYVLEGK